MRVAIIDYGSGNLRSAAKAFERAAREAGLTAAIDVTDDARSLATADRIVLPGVGAFADCKRGLAAVSGMTEALIAQVIDGGKPFLGICVGMQLMAERGLEHGVHDGFGWIAGDIAQMIPSDNSLKIPHMGWNQLRLVQAAHPVLDGIGEGDHAYFVHSYALAGANPAQILAEADHGGAFPAIVGRDNLVGTQFHPEKSQKTGLRLITNFLGWRP